MFKKFIGAAVVSMIAAASIVSCSSNVQRASESALAHTETGEVNKSAAPESVMQTVTTQEQSSEPAEELPTEPFSLDVSVPDDFDIPQSYVIDGFQTVMQEPELPTGCEVTSLTQTLNYLGFDVDKITLADEFMPIDMQGIVIMDEAYIGDPRLDGFGCNANIIVQTADKYFASIDSPCYGEELTGSSLREIFWQVSQGRPVITWATIDLKVTNPELVWTAGNGKDFMFNWYQHCLTLYGYDLDKGVVYAADPLKGNVTYPIDQFETVYGLMGNQCVVICGDSKTEGHHVTTEAEKSVTMHTLKEFNEEQEAAERGTADSTDDEPESENEENACD
ncbi:MAG: C39 family peptidase [Ruminococcus sp.]|nr:C39 family peptidase [Ruminococcus sp.]